MLEAALKAAREIAERAKSENRSLTDDEVKDIEAKLAKADDLKAKIAAAEKGDALWAKINGLGTGSGSVARLKFDRKAMARKAMTGSDGETLNVKALVGTGASLVGTEFTPEPVALGRPVPSVLDLFGAVKSARDYSYLRQTSRDNQAAPVAPGAVKPTSVYQMERVESRLKVIAHLSEPLNKYWLQDNDTLAKFIADELLFGLELALVNQILDGDGTGESLQGLATTPGVQTQAFETNAFLTTRGALNQIELLGYEGAGFVMHPNDWLAIETVTLTTGQFMFGEAGAPIDRVARRLWGVPVVLSNQTEAGTAWLIGDGAAALRVDENPIVIEWAMSGDDFQRNQIRARCEGRFDLATMRPSAVVKIAMA